MVCRQACRGTEHLHSLPLPAALSQDHRELLMPYWWIGFRYVRVCIFKKWIRCEHLKVTVYIKILISSFLFLKNQKIWQKLAAMQWFVPLDGIYTPSFPMVPTWPPPPSKCLSVAESPQAQAIRNCIVWRAAVLCVALDQQGQHHPGNLLEIQIRGPSP